MARVFRVRVTRCRALGPLRASRVRDLLKCAPRRSTSAQILYTRDRRDAAERRPQGPPRRTAIGVASLTTHGQCVAVCGPHVAQDSRTRSQLSRVRGSSPTLGIGFLPRASNSLVAFESATFHPANSIHTRGSQEQHAEETSFGWEREYQSRTVCTRRSAAAHHTYGRAAAAG